MMIWSGMGFLVPLIFVAAFGLEVWLGDQVSLDTPWQNFAVFALAGAMLQALWGTLARGKLNLKPTQALWWRELLAGSHSLYFIPLRFWGLISLAIGIFGYFAL